MALEAELLRTLDRIGKRYDQKAPQYVKAGIMDQEIATYASYVEYGWVQRVTYKQHHFFFKPRLGQDAPPIGTTLFNPPRPFLGATFDFYYREWLKLLAQNLWFVSRQNIEHALDEVGDRMETDIKMTIVKAGTPTVKFAERSPLTMALYSQAAQGHYMDDTPGGIKRKQPLFLTGKMLNAVKHNLE